uniref:uncharacterized protein LOC120328584 n=1 Tax=Styela clava TaxID=7725 RepID=UPI001939963F|nr:uncharacterized protein LOC120328584 [Styela clava]
MAEKNELNIEIGYLCANSISTVLLLYITICQMIIFIRKRLYKTRIRSVKDVLKPSNIQLPMNVTLVVSGIFGISLSACLTAVNIDKVTFYNCFMKLHKDEMDIEMQISSGLELNSEFEKCHDRTDLSKLYLTAHLLYTCLITSVYMVLWFRQTMFNTEPTLKRLSSKYLRIFSYFQGCFIIISGLLMGIIWIYHLANMDYYEDLGILTYVFLSIQLEIQIAILILFLVPLIKHQRRQKFLHQNQKPPDRLIRLMKRCTAATIVAMVTDIATIVVFQIAFEYLMSINAFINICCVLFCYADWREKFFPCLVLCKNDKAKAEQVTPGNDNRREM